jgi:hypothetical protein
MPVYCPQFRKFRFSIFYLILCFLIFVISFPQIEVILCTFCVTNNFTSKFDVVLTVHRRYYVEIKCQLDATEEFLLQILVLAEHVSGTIMPIIRNSRVLYKWLLPVVFSAVKMEIVIFRLAAIVFSALSAVRLLWGMSGVVGAVCGCPRTSQTRCSMSAVMVCSACVIRSQSSLRDMGDGGT